MASLTTADGTTWRGPNPGTERGEGTFLSSNKAGTKLVYCAGNVVIVRDVADPSVCEIYREHKSRTTVAKFSPSGNYIASGDDAGKVRVWAYDHPEKILKKEIFACGEALTSSGDPIEAPRRLRQQRIQHQHKGIFGDDGVIPGRTFGHAEKGAHVRDEAHETLLRRVGAAGEAFKVYFTKVHLSSLS